MRELLPDEKTQQRFGLPTALLALAMSGGGFGVLWDKIDQMGQDRAKLEEVRRQVVVQWKKIDELETLLDQLSARQQVFHPRAGGK